MSPFNLILNLLRALRLLLIAILCVGPRWTYRFLTLSGPAFVKVGQFLSARPDIVGDKVAADLRQLRDRMPSFPLYQAKRIMKQDFGYIFNADKPVAAASIAQVYHIEDVAIKLRRPKVERRILANIEFMIWFVDIMALFSSQSVWRHAREILILVRVITRRELDFRLEAANIDEFSGMPHPGIVTPQVNWNMTSERVLTMQWIEGCTLAEASSEEIQNGARCVIRAFLTQSCKIGLFHADMHSGNMLITSTGEVALLDFGKVGRLSLWERYYLLEVFRGLIAKNYKAVARVHLDLGYLTDASQLGWLESHCRAVGASIVGHPMASASKLLKQMLDIANRFGMPAQPSLMLFHKNLLMLEGTFNEHISFDMWSLTQEWLAENNSITRLIKQRYVLALRQANITKIFFNDLRSLIKPRRNSPYLPVYTVVFAVIVVWIAISLNYSQ